MNSLIEKEYTKILKSLDINIVRTSYSRIEDEMLNNRGKKNSPQE